MNHCVHPEPFSKRRNRWQDKRKRQLQKLANMRAAKERKRLERGPREEEPRLIKWHRFEIGVRDKVTGRSGYGEAWMDLVSIRDVVRRLRVIVKECGIR